MIGRVEAYYNSIAPGYDDHYSDPKSLAEDEALRLELLKYKGLNILDVGCGTGHLIDILEIDPNKYLGLDISSGMIKVARHKHQGYAFKNKDIKELTKEDYRGKQLIYYGYGSAGYIHIRDIILSFMTNADPGAKLFVMLYNKNSFNRLPGEFEDDRKIYDIDNKYLKRSWFLMSQCVPFWDFELETGKANKDRAYWLIYTAEKE